MTEVLIDLHSNAAVSFYLTGIFISVQIAEGTILFKTDNHAMMRKKVCLLTCQEDIARTLTAEEDSAVLLTISGKHV